MKLGKKKQEDSQQKQETPDEDMIAYLGIHGYQVPEGFTQVESYPLNPPFSYAWVFQNDSEGGFFYVVDELPMSRNERDSYKRLKNILEYELKAPKIDETLADSFHRQLPIILEDHHTAFGETNQVGLRKIVYYLEKDLIGYGKIDGLISDPFIEDISCLGINKPVYIYHRKYASTRTNIIFMDEEELDDFVTRIVHRQGKHVSIAVSYTHLTLPTNREV